MASPILTTRAFIEKARVVHGERYDYSAVDYRRSNQAVTINCGKHGAFEQKPNSHLQGNGCPLCARGLMGRPLTTSAFVVKALVAHGERYDYSAVDYQHTTQPVTIICNKHGAFQQKPATHLLGKGCPRCAGCHSTEDFITDAKEKYGDFYDYSQVVYVKSKIPVTIVCPIHGPFEQEPRSHLSSGGCAKCGKARGGGRSSTEKFIESARAVHGDLYDYSQVDYGRVKTNVTIICRTHGPFQQTPQKHLSVKRGCQKCAVAEAQRKQSLLDRGGWNCGKWIKTQRGRRALLYVLQLQNETELFYKIGITYSFRSRFSKHSMPYRFTVLALFESDDASLICDLEGELLKRFAHLRYTPLISFHGRGECLLAIEGVLTAPELVQSQISRRELTLPP